jgi:hypothetical protein
MEISVIHLAKAVQKARWIEHKRLYELFTFNGAKIFGGAARDYIIRDLAVKKFIQAEHDFADYGNPEVQPDTYADRLLLPKDIDILVTEHQADCIQRSLKRKYIVEEREVVHQYDIDPEKLRHIRIVLKPIRVDSIYCILKTLLGAETAFHIVAPDEIKIDMLVILGTQQVSLPIGQDFLCNQVAIIGGNFNRLKVIPLGDYAGDEGILTEHENMSAILDDIKEKRARILNTEVPFFRMKKMKDKGYTICLSPKLAIVKEPTAAAECVICKDTIDNLYVTPCNCVAEYHPECYKEHIRFQINMGVNTACAMCRSPIPDKRQFIENLQDIDYLDTYVYDIQ